MLVSCNIFIKNHIPLCAKILEEHNKAHQERRKFCMGTSKMRSLQENQGHSLRVNHVSLNALLKDLLVQVNPNTNEEKTISTFSQNLNLA